MALKLLIKYKRFKWMRRSCHKQVWPEILVNTCMDLSESLSSYLLNLKNYKFDTLNWWEILSRQRIFHSLQNLDSTIYTYLLWSTAVRMKVLATENLISVPLFTLAIYGRSAVWANQAVASHLKWRSVFLTIFFMSVLRGRVQTTVMKKVKLQK